MDLLSGMIAANAPIGRQDPVGSYATGVKAAATNRQQQLENEKNRYVLDLQYKMQDVINKSVDDAGNLDYDKLGLEGRKAGMSQHTIDYMIKTLPATWEAAQKATTAKSQIGAVAPKTEQELVGATKPSWRSKPAKDKSTSTLAVATPTVAQAPAKSPVPAEVAPPVDHTGGSVEEGRLPPMEGDYVSPDQREYANQEGGQVVVTAPAPEEAPAPAPEPVAEPSAPQNVFAIANQADVTSPENQAGTSQVVDASQRKAPLSYADLPADTKKMLFRAYGQESKIGRDAKVTDDTAVQAAIENDYQKAMAAVGPIPTRAMFLSPDKGFDVGAYNRAIGEYNTAVNAAEQKWRQDMGAKYGTQLAQQLQLQANTRATQAAGREATDFAQKQSEIIKYRGQGYDANTSNLEQVRTVESQMRGFDLAIDEAKRLENFKGSDSDFNLALQAILQHPKLAEGITSLSADEGFMANLAKKKTLTEIASKTGVPVTDMIKELLLNRTVGSMDNPTRARAVRILVETIKETGIAAAQREGLMRKGWRNQPAKAPKASQGESKRLPGETLADYFRRTRK